MKNLLLATILQLAILSAVAQQAATFPRHLLNQPVEVEYVRPVKDLPHSGIGINPAIHSPVRTLEEFQVGTTWYDLQTNYMLQNRIYFNPADETIGIVWTKGMTATAFPDRGTGYNFFNGSSWLPEPEVRIEDERTGWPNYAPLGPNGEIVIAHLASGLKISTRAQKGTGAWTYATLMGPAGAPDLTWPRMITSGPDNQYIHMIANTYDPYLGQTSALLYYRSLDGGQTWDIEGELLDGLGADYYTEIGADAYGWADAKGDTIAFLCASAWHDMFAMKSYDNGETWEKVLIWEHPYPFFDWETTLADTFFCTDNSGAIALDNEGKVHVVFGINRVMHMELGTTYSYFPYIDGVGYWNEDMPPFSNDLSALAPPQYEYASSEMIEDFNYIGWTQDVDGDGEITFVVTPTGFPMAYRTLGISTFPAISIDNEGNILVVFASTTETFANAEYNYKHIWARAHNNYDGWLWFTDLSADIFHIFDEFYFPQIASHSSDDAFHLVYNIDGSPGIAWSDQHAYQENRLVYAKVYKEEVLPVGIKTLPGKETIAVSQNYPNPAAGYTYIRVDLDAPSVLSLQVTDLAGKAVMTLDKGKVNAGGHYFEIDARNLPAGIYLYKVQAGTSAVTRKMAVSR